MRIQVDCYAGYRGEETPRRIRLSDRTIRVLRVCDRWLAPDHRYFKVVCDDDCIYIIRHDTCSDFWGLTFFRRTDLAPVQFPDNPPSRLTA
jgi:hypothetical protein